MPKLSYLQAVRQAFLDEMRRDDTVFMMGEDISWNLMGASGGFLDEFGAERVRDTPISEAGFVGAAAGAAMVGMRPIVDMMIAPFMYCAMDQFVSIMAKSTYLYGGQTHLPITVRAPMLYSNSNAAQHSDRPMSTFMTVPGLKIIAPTSPRDMLGLVKTAIRDDDPVIVFDDATLWTSSAVIEDSELDNLIPLGSADVKRSGSDVTIVAIAGAMKHALIAAETLGSEGISVEVVDPRSLVPLDMRTILDSVAKTGRVVLADPSHRTLSVVTEIAAEIVEHGFGDLRAPVIRVTTPTTHIPFSPPLESGLFPTADRIADAVRRVTGVVR